MQACYLEATAPVQAHMNADPETKQDKVVVMRAMIVDDESDRSQVRTILAVLRDEFHLEVDEFLAQYAIDEFCEFVRQIDEPPEIAIIDYRLNFRSDSETWQGGDVA